jgi:hypothetical protein
VLDGFDRGCHELGRIVGDLVLYSGWKRPFPDSPSIRQKMVF